MAIDIGISKEDRESIAAQLGKLLADTYSLYLKTHGFHWNVTGPMFNTLHLMFETQYQELWAAADVVAERMRALDVHAGLLHPVRQAHLDRRGNRRARVEGHGAAARRRPRDRGADRPRGVPRVRRRR